MKRSGSIDYFLVVVANVSRYPWATSKFEWNKKAVAIITVAAFVGALSPISASAWDNTNPDEIVTATVDLGNGNGGGGGGGGTDSCTGFSSLNVPTSTLPLTYQTTRAKATWIDDPALDGNDNNGTFDDDTASLNLPFEQWNTQRDYVSEDFEIQFDANNCVGSQDWAELVFQRMPVERASVGGGWYPVEMTNDHGVLAADNLRATADLVLDRGLVNGNVNSIRVFDNIWNSIDIAGNNVNSENINDWGTLGDDLSNIQQPQGTSGVADLKAMLTLFGDEAKGKYRVKYGVDMWIND